jgi:phage gpG-like protein
MLQLDFQVEGAEKVSRTLGITASAVRSFKEPLSAISRDLLKTFDMNFSARGALYGGWAPRKPQYRGGQRIDNWPLMEKTGRMRKSFKSKVSRTSVELFNPTPYFVCHQTNRRRSGRLPRRAMMKLRRQDADMVVKEFQKYLIKLARKSGAR